MRMRLKRRLADGSGLGRGGIAAAAVSVALVVGGVVFRPLSYAAALFVAGYLLLASPERMWYELFILLPFANIFKFSPASSSIYTYLQIIAVARVLLKRRRIDWRFLIVYAVLVLVNFAGCGGDTAVLIKQSLIPLMLYSFFRTRTRYRTLLLAFTAGLLASSVIALFRSQIPNLASYARLIRSWQPTGYTYRFCGLFRDPNYYTMLLIMSLIGLMTLYNAGQLHGSFFLYYVTVGLFGAMTASKSFLLMYAAVSCVLALMRFKRKKLGWSILLIVSLTAMVLLSRLGYGTIFDSVLQRFGAGELTTGRADIWVEYLTYLGSNPLKLLLGSGIGAGYLAGYAAHNTYIDFLYYYGLLGTALFIVCCRYAVGRTRRMRRSLNNAVMFGGLAALLFFLSGLQVLEFGYMLILCCMAWRNRSLRPGQYEA